MALALRRVKRKGLLLYPLDFFLFWDKTGPESEILKIFIYPRRTAEF